MNFAALRWMAVAFLALLGVAAPLPAQTPVFTMTGANTWTYDPDDGGTVITGILRVPTGTGPFPAVLISHGKGGSAGGFSLPHANVLVGWGLVCIGPDYTHAGSAVNSPDNEGYCPENSRRARACLAILQMLGTVDMARVAAFGHSMGSFLTGGLLGEIPASFRAACISAGGTTGLSDPGFASPATQEVSGITAPFLMFHGTADTTVPPSQSVNLRNILNGNLVPNKRLLYQGIGHDIVSPPVKRTDIHAIMRGWFTEHGVLAFSGDTAPTITTAASVTVTSGVTSAPLAISVGDGQTSASSLAISAFTTDDARLPNSGLALGGSGSARTLTINPTAGQTGIVEVALVVHDGQLSTVSYIEVTIEAAGSAGVNHRPGISWIADQRATPGAVLPALAFSVSDAETAPAALSVVATSSNLVLLPVANIALTSGSANRTATLTPASGQTGSTTVTLTVSDGTKTSASSFTVTVAANVGGNTAPVIQGIANETIVAGSAYGPLPLVIKDTESSEGALTLSVASSNTVLVPATNIVFGGQNWGRTLTTTPAAGQTGRSVITLAVSDGTYTTSTSFVLDVVSGDTPPTISALPTTHTPTLGSTPQAIAFNVSDAETAVADLRVTASSSNTALVPAANIVVGGSGSLRSVTITPPPGQTGATTVTLTVSDGDITRTAQLLYAVVNPAGAAAQFSRPRGVFILDSGNTATYTTSFGITIALRDANIRNLPFVDGFTLRAAWTDMESATTPGSYDFFIIENALNKLPAGQRLSLIIVPSEPAYIAATPGVDTWVDDTTTRAKPWDAYLRERRRALLAAMSQHLVGGVPLGQDPRLDLLDPYLPGGFTGIRDPNSTQLRNIPGYTRQKFLEAVQDELRTLQGYFPGKFVQIGFWPIIDNENANYGGVTAWEWLRQQLLAEFDGVTRPRVGFFMENLAAKRNGPAIDPYTSTPVTGFASALNASKDATWNGFQMLGSWTRPFNDGHVNNTINGTPNDAMEAAFNTYRAEYHEVYVGDIDTAAFQPALQRWHDFYASAASTNPNSDEDRDGLPLWWELNNGLHATRNDGTDGASGDPEIDGLGNLLEFALNLDPRASDIAGQPTTAIAINAADNQPYLTFTYARRTDAPWLSYLVETSPTLNGWNGSSMIEPVGVPVPTGDGVSESVIVRILPAIGPGNPARFARLVVTSSP